MLFVFQIAIHKFERLRAQQREAQRQAEHLFQTLLHRAFRGEVCNHEAHERSRKARKAFVNFAVFRDLRGPNAPQYRCDLEKIL